MAGTLGSLVVSLEANIASFEASLNRAEQVARGNMARVEESVSLAKKAFVALGIAASAGAFAESIKGSIQMMDDLDKLSTKTGVTVESLSAMKTSAKYAEVSMQEVGAAAQKLSANMVEFATTGGGKAARAFEALGINVRDASGHMKTADAVMLEAAKSLDKFRDGAIKTALERDLFGKTGADLAGFLKELSDRGLENARVTSEEAKEAAAYNDNLKALETQSHKMSMALAREMLPALNDITTAMVQAAKDSGILMAAWVGLGGVMAHILGMDDASKASQHLAEVSKQIDVITKQLNSGTLNPSGASDKFFSFLIPDVKLSSKARAQLETSLKNLVSERDRIMAQLNAKPDEPTVLPEPDIPDKDYSKKLKAAILQFQAEDMAHGNQALDKELALISKITNAYDEFKGVLASVSGVEKTHAITLQEKLDKMYALDPEYRSQLQGIIDQTAAQERLNRSYKDAIEFEDVMRRSDDVALRSIEEQSAAEDAQAKALEAKALALKESLDPQLKMMNMQDEYFQMLSDGLITQEEYDKALLAMRDKGDTTFADMKRAIEGYGDAFANMVASGKMDFKSLITSILSDIERLMIKRSVTDPLMRGIDSMFSGSASNMFDSMGGWFKNLLPSYAVGTDYVPNDQIAMIHKGERIVPAGQNKVMGSAGSSGVVVNVYEAPGTQATVQQQPNKNGGMDISVIVEQLTGLMSRDIQRGNGLAPTIERRYGLNRTSGGF